MQLLVCLHPLRCDRDTEAVPKTGDGTNDGERTGFLRTMLDKRTVNLDAVEREATQVVETGVAASEVVHGNSDPKRPQLVQGRQCRFGFHQQYSLGDFKFQAARR